MEWSCEIYLDMGREQPKVSIVIPVYNGDVYLESCLDSIIHQSWLNLEIICIDDGSTDRSGEILAAYAEKDERFIIISQQNCGAGMARNAGMERASGKYIIFLDSDDYFDTHLIEESVCKAEAYDADIVVFRAVIYNSKTTWKRSLNDKIRHYRRYEHSTFSVQDIPDTIFNSFLPVAWNKLYNLNFLKSGHLCFQELKRSNDMFFTMTSLVKAQRIIILNKVLLYYRKGMQTNLQAQNEQTPLEFYKALIALKAFLEKEQRYELTEKSFLKLALETTFYTIHSIRNREIKEKLIQFMNESGWSRLGLRAYNKLYALDGLLYGMYKMAETGRMSLLKLLYVAFKMKQYGPHMIENVKWNIMEH